MLHAQNLPDPKEAKRYVWLAIAAAIITITLKLLAWKVSGSVGLFSDAMESFVNLASALFALMILRIAHEPPDENHPFGHTKAEYFSSAFEGTMITVAALLILQGAIPRLFSPKPLEAVGMGIWFSIASIAVNFTVATIMLRAGKRLNSIVLTADARHLMTDVWTTLGVIIGLGAVILTDWLWLDAILAIAVALHILKEGYKLLKDAINGLMDEALPPEEIDSIKTLLTSYEAQGVYYRKLRTRASASQRFVMVNLLIPQAWDVGHAHQLADEIEKKVSNTLGNAFVTTHVEPLEVYKDL